ncbi:MAG: hypothetical protein ABI597_03760 [Gammaproteobacteria bacterium]
MSNSSINSNPRLSTSQIAWVIFAIWLVSLFILGGLQLLNLPFGFAVWPMGEDRNWLGFMHDGKGLEMMHEFWKMNDRNPLSPWWWFIGSPLIYQTDWGLYLIRKCVDPFLAIITFFLLDRLGHKQCRTFAFCVAIVVLVWNFSGSFRDINYFNQIFWDFLVALGFSLLTIFFYCRYIDNQRTMGSDLGLAMICYFISIASYTLQSGAIIAVAFLGLFRLSKSQNWITRLKHALVDTGFFAAIFLIFNCIWYTVNRNGHAFYQLNWHTFSDQFLTSMRQFFFHTLYLNATQLTQADWSLWVISVIFIVVFLLFCFILFKFPANKVLDSQVKIPIAWTCMVLLAIALPTMIVESTSNIWYPGSRSLMVQQVWQPMLYIGIIFFIANLFPAKNSQRLRRGVLIAVALIGALASVLNLNYNYRLVVRTQYQATLAKGLKQLNIPQGVAPFFLVKITGLHNQDIDTIPILIGNYGQSLLHQDNATLRTFASQPDPLREHYWRIKFGPTGVVNAGPIGDDHSIPYNNVWIVFFDGKKVWVPERVDKNDFLGLQVDWLRNTPINQTNKKQ